MVRGTAVGEEVEGLLPALGLRLRVVLDVQGRRPAVPALV
jgi:hypothetical protein